MHAQATSNCTSTGTVVARYLQGLNIDEPLAMLRSSATSYYEADARGSGFVLANPELKKSITSLSNSSGSIVNTYSYNSFGSLLSSTGSVVNPFRFTGRESDSETGLYFYRARYYDSSSGRFLSEDPVGTAGGINFYSYAGNSPTNFNDAFGYDYTTDRSAMGPIYVNASITVYGPGASNALAEKWQRAILENWNNNPGFGKCRVFFNVRVIFDPKAKDWRHAISPPGFPGANNFFFVPKGSPADLGNPEVNINLFTGTIPSDTLTFTVSHEFGHLLHLFDSNRFGKNWNPWRPKDDIMNEGLVISQYDINRIVAGGNASTCGCK